MTGSTASFGNLLFEIPLITSYSNLYFQDIDFTKDNTNEGFGVSIYDVTTKSNIDGVYYTIDDGLDWSSYHIFSFPVGVESKK